MEKSNISNVLRMKRGLMTFLSEKGMVGIK
jgi:hypothetical protein